LVKSSYFIEKSSGWQDVSFLFSAEFSGELLGNLQDIFHPAGKD
jgi:hypothetical protein